MPNLKVGDLIEVWAGKGVITHVYSGCLEGYYAVKIDGVESMVYLGEDN